MTKNIFSMTAVMFYEFGTYKVLLLCNLYKLYVYLCRRPLPWKCSFTNSRDTFVQ